MGGAGSVGADLAADGGVAFVDADDAVNERLEELVVVSFGVKVAIGEVELAISSPWDTSISREARLQYLICMAKC